MFADVISLLMVEEKKLPINNTNPILKGRYITMPDKYLTCENCGTEFDYLEDEHAFYEENGVDNEPAQCPMCKRAHKNDSWSRSGDFNRY